MIQPVARGRNKPQGPVGLRRDAEKIAGALPPLLAQAEMLAATVAMGEHGRRRAGTGENFWQYRQAAPGRRALDGRLAAIGSVGRAVHPRDGMGGGADGQPLGR